MSIESSFSAIATALSALLRATLDPRPAARAHGGCISESYRWNSDRGPLFVKVAAADRLTMLELEALGLRELAGANAVRVPHVMAVGAAGGTAYLALEWLWFAASSSATEAAFGEQLARQHRKCAEAFGWHRDNTIGNTPQINTLSQSWPAFFREHRLRFQLHLAHENGHVGYLQQRGLQLLERMDDFFSTHKPSPSLLHGDLWGGNWGADSEGVPVIFDPAVYYGDREADIAMTRLFGGFGPGFYSAYQAAWPLDDAADTRATLYNLYHVLNHLNLFGNSYRCQAESMIDRLLAELGH